MTIGELLTRRIIEFLGDDSGAMLEIDEFGVDFAERGVHGVRDEQLKNCELGEMLN